MYAHQQPQANQLPVPFDRPVDNGLWSQNPYNDNRLPMPQVAISQDFMWVIPTVVGALVESFQNACQRGPVSTFAFNLFSLHAYRNEIFLQVALEAVNYAVFRLKTSGNSNYQQEVIQAAANYARVATATCVRHYPQILQYCPPVAQQDINATLQQWQAVKAQMGNASSGIPHQQQPQHLGIQPQGYSPGVQSAQLFSHTGIMAHDPTENRGRGAYVEQRPMADGMDHVHKLTAHSHEVHQPQTFHESNIPQADYIDGKVVSVPAPQEDHRPSAEWTVDELPDINTLDFDSDIPNSFVNEPVFDFEQLDDSEKAGFPSKDTVEAGRVIARAPSMNQTAEIDVDQIGEDAEWIDQYLGRMSNDETDVLEVIKFLGTKDRPWDAVVCVPIGDEDHERMLLLTPALLSNSHTVTRCAHQAHRSTAYNPQTHMLFHAVEYGELEPVYEYIAPLEDSMRYVLHEFNEELRQKAAARVSERENDKVDMRNLFVITPRVAKNTPEADAAHLEQLDNRAREEKEGAEFNFTVRKKAVMLPGCEQQSIDESLARIEEYRAATLIQDEDGVDLASLYEAYGMHQAKFYVKESLASTAADVVAAYTAGAPGAREMVMFLHTYASEIGKDRFYNRLNDLLSQRLNAVLYHSMGLVTLSVTDFAHDYEEVLNILKDYGPAQTEAFHKLMDKHVAQVSISISSNCLQLSTQYVVLHINRTLDAMGFYPLRTGAIDGAISVSTHRDLYLALAAVYERVAPMNRKHGAQVFIVSSDDQVLQLHRSAWDKHYISTQIITDRNLR